MQHWGPSLSEDIRKRWLRCCFYQVGKFVEELSLGRTKKSIAEFIDIRPEYANLKVGNKEKIVPPQELELKQIIVLRPGEKIPVDCVVTQGSGTIDTKALTGESEPRAVKTGDRLYSGSINMNGVLEARVKKLYNDSTAARIIRMVESANENKADSVHFAAKFTRFYTPIVILIALLTHPSAADDVYRVKYRVDLPGAHHSCGGLPVRSDGIYPDGIPGRDRGRVQAGRAHQGRSLP